MLRIKELLKEKKITTYQLAEKLDITQSAVSQAINGNPSAEWLLRVANILGVGVGDLFERKDEVRLFAECNGERVEITHSDIINIIAQKKANP